MLFKILHGDASRISTDITPFHEGYCYVTYDGSMYVDMNLGTETAPNNKRVQLNAKDALTSIEAQALINQNNGEKVQLWVGTQAELDAIEERDANCVYFTTDEIDFDPNDVLLVTEQELTEEQKAQARANIGAMAIGDSNLPSDFLTSGASDTVTWDGNTDGLESVYNETNNMYFYKIPNVKHNLTSEDFSQGVRVVIHSEMNGAVSDDELLVDSSNITIAQHPVLGEVYEISGGAYLSKTGDVYLPYMYETFGEAVAMAYCSSLTINGCSDAFQKTVINKDYLPSSSNANNIPNDFWTTKPIFYSDTFTWDGDTTGLASFDGSYKMATKHTLSIDNFPTNIKFTVYAKMTINGETQEDMIDVDISMFEQATGENADVGGKYIFFSHSTVGCAIAFVEDGSIYTSKSSGFHVCKINMPDVSDAFYISTEQPVVNQSYMNITIGTQDLEDGVSNLPDGAIYLVIEQ